MCSGLTVDPGYPCVAWAIDVWPDIHGWPGDGGPSMDPRMALLPWVALVPRLCRRNLLPCIQALVPESSPHLTPQYGGPRASLGILLNGRASGPP